MKKATEGTTTSILENNHCKDCGWPVIHACCNDDFQKHKDAKTWDWWLYCSNKGCKNHEGEGVFQDWPDWIKSEKTKRPALGLYPKKFWLESRLEDIEEAIKRYEENKQNVPLEWIGEKEGIEEQLLIC